MDMTIEELAARVDALAAENLRLRAQLEAARGGLDLTMRGQGRCRACGGTKILHATEVVDRDDGGPKALSVGASSWRKKPQGTFETYICVGCGLAEWYVKDPTAVRIDGEKVRWRDGEDGGGPYR